jgi:hypothetical protein
MAMIAKILPLTSRIIFAPSIYCAFKFPLFYSMVKVYGESSAHSSKKTPSHLFQPERKQHFIQAFF